MWTHYANNHKGFCLGFDRNAIEKEELVTLDWLNTPINFQELVHLLQMKYTKR